MSWITSPIRDGISAIVAKIVSTVSCILLATDSTRARWYTSALEVGTDLEFLYRAIKLSLSLDRGG
jgi:hypothetical protein